MSFLKLDLKTEYRNQHIDVLNEFYLPLFEESKLYCRAVGFSHHQFLQDMQLDCTVSRRIRAKLRLWHLQHYQMKILKQ